MKTWIWTLNLYTGWLCVFFYAFAYFIYDVKINVGKWILIISLNMNKKARSKNKVINFKISTTLVCPKVGTVSKKIPEKKKRPCHKLEILEWLAFSVGDILSTNLRDYKNTVLTSLYLYMVQCYYYWLVLMTICCNSHKFVYKTHQHDHSVHNFDWGVLALQVLKRCTTLIKRPIYNAMYIEVIINIVGDKLIIIYFIRV